MNKRSLADIIKEKKAALALQAEERKIEAEAQLDKKVAPALPAVTEVKNTSSPVNPTSLPISLKERLALLKTKTAALNKTDRKAEGSDATPSISPSAPLASLPTLFNKTEKIEEDRKKNETFSLSVELNERQLLAKEMAFSGKSFCLIGAAGTGKTTAQREIAAELLRSGSLQTHTFRIQGEGQKVVAPSIAFIAYTRIASGNLKRAIHKDLELKDILVHNITTFHNLLEYSPETYIDMDDGKEKFRFLPNRTQYNPLDITHLVIEEASQIGLDHWEVLYKAMRCGVQVIFIGDINQLPPVFGSSILNYALVQLPVVELTHVYRQSGDSTILKNAHNILEGKPLEKAPDFQIVTSGAINHTQAKLAISYGSLTFPRWMRDGIYDPMEDIILSPFNKRDLGTINMNKWIAQSVGAAREAVVHEILAGRSTQYLAIGDKILYNKRVGVITDIQPNIKYTGKPARAPSVNLTRFGSYTGGLETLEELDSPDYTSLDLDKMLSEAQEEDKEDAVREASHVVMIELESEEKARLSAVGHYSDSVFSLAYALTVHKAQGCEWRKVFIILHRDHGCLLSRELLYTAVTRAREAIVLIAKEDVINKAIATQKIKGNSLAEKIEFFNGDVKQLNQAIRCTK